MTTKPGWYVWRVRAYYDGPWTEWWIADVHTVKTVVQEYVPVPPWELPEVLARGPNGTEVRGPFTAADVAQWYATANVPRNRGRR